MTRSTSGREPARHPARHPANEASHAPRPPASQPPREQLRDQLTDGLRQLDLPLSDTHIERCLDHLELIGKWNRVYNLTAVRDPGEMLTHHLLDSLAFVAALRRHGWPVGQGADLPSNAPRLRVLDVGSGAGLPGVPLAIAAPAVDVVCVDTVAKKTAFIQQVAVSLGLTNLRAEHARVEDLKLPPFDLITSRAFASLADLTALTLFHVKQGGAWAAMKGRDPAGEVAALGPGVRLQAIEPLTVPGLDEARCLVWLQPV